MGRHKKIAAGDEDLDKVIKDILNSGVKTSTELKEACLKLTAKTEQTYHRRLRKLVERGEIQKEERTYRLPLESRVKRAIENLRFRLLRNPSEQEVAREIGETPEKAHELVWKLIPETGWKEPSKKQISLDGHRLHEVYEIAALLEHFDEESVRKRALTSDKFTTRDNGSRIIDPGLIYLRGEPINKIIKRARWALKNERNKLPRITFVAENDTIIEFDYTWPEPTEESEIRWGDSSEIYDKTTKSFSGAFTGERQITIEEEEANGLSPVKKEEAPSDTFTV